VNAQVAAVAVAAAVVATAAAAVVVETAGKFSSLNNSKRPPLCGLFLS